MTQRWSNLLFAHWPVDAGRLRALVPSPLSLDMFDGTAWISLTPFFLSHLRLRGFPPVPLVSAFPELNVRTYVTVGDKPGVYFFSLDAGSVLAVAGARTFYRLPYYRARMLVQKVGESFHYVSHRTHGGAPTADFVATYRPTGDAARSTPGSLDHFLTER